MRILMLAPQPVLEPRGTPISVYQRLVALSALKHEIDLVTYHLGDEIEIPGVTVHRIPAVPFIKEVKPGPSLPKVLLDCLLFGKALILLCTRQYDVIHAHEEAAFFAILLAFLFDVRHLYDMHSSLPRQLGAFGFARKSPIRWLFKVMERWVLHTCDAVITVSLALQEHVQAINPAVKQVMIENLPVHAEAPPQDSEPSAKITSLGLDSGYLVVYTGTFEPYQGLDLLLQCAKIVSSRRPDVQFLMVGGRQNQVDYWRSEARRLDLNGNIRFTGIVPIQEVGGYVRMAHILVSPRKNGLATPLKIYDYMAAGKPIVATNIEAHASVLNPDMALLVDCTAEALATGILELMDKPEQAEALGLRAQEHAQEHFRFADYIAKVNAIYQTLHDAQPAAGPDYPYSTPLNTNSLGQQRIPTARE